MIGWNTYSLSKPIPIFHYFSTFPYEFCLRIWDCYLIRGEIFIYEVALALIKIQEHEIVNVNILI